MTAASAVTQPRERNAAKPLGLGSVLGGAVAVTLVRPVSWLLGLAGFLAGGGVMIVAWPILVLPTPTGLQNALGGPVSSLVFGAPSAGLVALIVAGLGGTLLLVVAGTLAGAWAERQGIAVALDAAAEEGLGLGDGSLAGAPGTGRVAIVRLLALVPVALAATLAWQPVYDAAYRQLVLPQDLVTPLPVRVVGDVPWLLAGLALVWLASDAAAAVGVRRLVLERRSVGSAWLLGWTDLVRRPLRVLPTALFGLGILVLLVAPAIAAAALGWDRLRDILGGGREPLIVIAAVVTWVAVFLGGLVLAGLGAGVRAAAWTIELSGRHRAGGPSRD